MANMDINLNINNLMEGLSSDSTHNFQYGAICDNKNMLLGESYTLRVWGGGINPKENNVFAVENIQE